MSSSCPRQQRSTVRLVLAVLAMCSFVAYPSPASCQRSPSPTTAPQPPLEEKIADYMTARARVTGFSGAVLVAREGQVVFRRAFGDANRELSAPNSPETKFRIGSVSKQFTAAAVLLLAQRGGLQLTDPVDKHLSDWPSAWTKVSIHHLLSHTAGLPRLTTRAMVDVSALSATTPTPFRSVRDSVRTRRGAPTLGLRARRALVGTPTSAISCSACSSPRCRDRVSAISSRSQSSDRSR